MDDDTSNPQTPSYSSTESPERVAQQALGLRGSVEPSDTSPRHQNRDNLFLEAPEEEWNSPESHRASNAESSSGSFSSGHGCKLPDSEDHPKACAQVISSKEEAKAHIRWHFTNSVKPLKEGSLDYRCPWNHDWEVAGPPRPVERKDRGVDVTLRRNMFETGVCNRYCNDRGAMRRHLPTHFPMTTVCEICGASYTRVDSLNRHRSKDHRREFELLKKTEEEKRKRRQQRRMPGVKVKTGETADNFVMIVSTDGDRVTSSSVPESQNHQAELESLEDTQEQRKKKKQRKSKAEGKARETTYNFIVTTERDWAMLFSVPESPKHQEMHGLPEETEKEEQKMQRKSRARVTMGDPGVTTSGDGVPSSLQTRIAVTNPCSSIR